VAIVAFGESLFYLTWRGLFTIALSSWWVSVPFFALEIYAVFSLALFAFSLWDIDVRPASRSGSAMRGRIAVLIPTYNESREILVPTVAAAVALKPAHETWLLDDGNRAEVEQLAKDLGARYLTRSDRRDAKAGNINHALATIDADFIAVLDADHVASPRLLRHTLGYFGDPKVALVQTPQDFYNLESFEHDRSENSRGVFHEQELFYRAIQPGKNRWDAAFWCGTGAVVRVAALRDIGGVATGTVTEDIHTTIRLHRRGWKTVYHNEVLARGLAASSAEQYQLQRLRWGTGAMQVLRKENPLIIRGLTAGQRIAYASTLLGWFEPWRTLGYLVLPAAVLLTGGMPVRANTLIFAVAFGTTLVLQQAALRLLSRGRHRFFLSSLFEAVRMTPNLRATLTILSSGRADFRVTPKGRSGDTRERISPPGLLVALVLLNTFSAIWFACTLAGWTPTHYASSSFAYGAVFWLILNTVLIVAAIARVSSRRYGPERRAAVRFATGLLGKLDGIPCRIIEISLTGARVSTDTSGSQVQSSGASRHNLSVSLLGQALMVEAAVRSTHSSEDGGMVYGLEFCDGQTESQARLALALLNRQVVLSRRPRQQQAA